uniref:Uncharacterized protein n=1 Tax=Aegilops tauschii subsp. strangulata TaxID=200361 RepID=A0A453GWU6_AEGTS
MAASTTTTTTTSSSGGMDKRLMKAATSGTSTSMYAMAALDRSILLGTTPQGNTCLHIFCIYGHEGFCKDVLELEESLIKAVNLDGETPLITAVRNGHVSVASFLLAQHCSVLGLRQAIRQQDVYGFNALHHAIRNGHKDHALELIAAEPALSQAVGKHNESPMYFAVMRNFTQVFEKLMQNPLSASSGGQHGRNCLHAAVKNGDQEFVKIIMKERPELAREADTSKSTPIANAVQYDMVDILQVMLEHDSTLGYLIGNNGLPLLNIAAYREFVEFVLRTPILRKLVNMQDKNGRTALHLAVARCNPRAVAALLSHVDIDATLLDNKGDIAAWELYSVMKNAKTINWAFASSSASNSKELDELNYKHEWSEEDLNLLLKEQMDKAQG